MPTRTVRGPNRGRPVRGPARFRGIQDRRLAPPRSDRRPTADAGQRRFASPDRSVPAALGRSAAPSLRETSNTHPSLATSHCHPRARGGADDPARTVVVRPASHAIRDRNARRLPVSPRARIPQAIAPATQARAAPNSTRRQTAVPVGTAVRRRVRPQTVGSILPTRGPTARGRGRTAAKRHIRAIPRLTAAGDRSAVCPSPAVPLQPLATNNWNAVIHREPAIVQLASIPTSVRPRSPAPVAVPVPRPSRAGSPVRCRSNPLRQSTARAALGIRTAPFHRVSGERDDVAALNRRRWAHRPSRSALPPPESNRWWNERHPTGVPTATRATTWRIHQTPPVPPRFRTVRPSTPWAAHKRRRLAMTGDGSLPPGQRPGAALAGRQPLAPPPEDHPRRYVGRP